MWTCANRGAAIFVLYTEEAVIRAQRLLNRQRIAIATCDSFADGKC